MYQDGLETMGCGSSKSTQVKKKIYKEYYSEQSTGVSVISSMRGDPDGEDDILGEINEGNPETNGHKIHNDPDPIDVQNGKGKPAESSNKNRINLT